MSTLYIQRSLEPVLKNEVAEFPAVVVTGPRQSGKATLLKQLFGDQCMICWFLPPRSAGRAVPLCPITLGQANEDRCVKSIATAFFTKVKSSATMA